MTNSRDIPNPMPPTVTGYGASYRRDLSAWVIYSMPGSQRSGILAETEDACNYVLASLRASLTEHQTRSGAMNEKKPGLLPPDVDWNDMKPGQIAWHVSRKPDGWEVSRVYGPDSLLSGTEHTT